jgi:hypothetical protein
LQVHPNSIFCDVTMTYHIRSFPDWNSSKTNSTSFAQRPFAIQTKQDSSAHTQDDQEEAFSQHKFEAFGLQMKQKSGTITPIEQETLGVLQAKMDDFWVQRQQRRSPLGHSLANFSLTHGKGEAPSADSPQPRLQRSPLSAANATIQRAHRKGASRVAEAKRGKNAIKRERRKQEAAQQQQASEEWSNTVSSWASWAWDSAKSVGSAMVKTVAGGIDPFEVVATLRGVYNSNASINQKIQYLAIYGTYQVSEYLKANLATIVGGDVGAMLEMQDEVDGHLEALSNLWETGEIDEGQVHESIADQILEALG